ncbi:hypothetical protein P148_SR1C00001G0132 [candidate division SR1 bacterium RAAC1_SR1_1]|nr:hypothetical protein P148_SR1C00001G0132 [candidate division SR1 bacterium RAAC1_SR1_1]
MYQIDPITLLAKETNHLPESSFYLGLADILAVETEKEIKDISRRNYRIKKIEEVQKNLQYALLLFNTDKNNYQENQKQGFLQKKICVDQKLRKLRDNHNKMLLKELVIV